MQLTANEHSFPISPPYLSPYVYWMSHWGGCRQLLLAGQDWGNDHRDLQKPELHRSSSSNCGGFEFLPFGPCPKKKSIPFESRLPQWPRLLQGVL